MRKTGRIAVSPMVTSSFVRQITRIDMQNVESTLGSFVAAQFRAARVLPAAIKLFGGEELANEDITPLASAPLPVLAKLVEISTLGRTAADGGEYRPVFFIPLALMLEQAGSQRAQMVVAEELRSVDETLDLGRDLSVALDRWYGNFSFGELLRVFSQVLQSRQFRHTVVPVGPSTAEVVQLAHRYYGEKSQDSLFAVLQELNHNGICRLDGGTDLDIHAAALRLGFSLSVGQNISHLFEQDYFYRSSSVIGPDKARRLFEERFIGELLEVRYRLAPSNRLAVWFPWTDATSGKSRWVVDQAFAVPFLRVIALARLFLPREVAVRAPSSVLGKHLAGIALQYGASDLGFVAVDSRTAESLDLARMSEVTNVFGQRSIFEMIS